MKYLFSLCVIFFTVSCGHENTEYETEIRSFQYELNREYADATTSPLTEEGLKSFKSLDFFDIDKNYRVEANFELTPNTPIFEMQTTTERLPLYRKYGVAHFTLQGKEMELSIYQSQELMSTFTYKNYLFLPFNDASNGQETYGGGRFIELEIPEEKDKIIIDFNKAYNPYCAYNHKYSCPIPPKENNLSIKILAGVKAYELAH